MKINSSKQLSQPVFYESAADSEIVLDREFQTFIPKASQISDRELERSVQIEGVEMPLIVWVEENRLVDGYRRWQLILKYELPFSVIYKSFPDRYAVKQWMIDRQMASRNLTSTATACLRGRETQTLADRTIARAKQDKDSGDEDLDAVEVKRIEKASRKKVAEKYSIGDETIKTDLRYCKALDAIASDISIEAANQIKDGEIKLNKLDTIDVAKAVKKAPDSIKEVFDRETEGKEIKKQVEIILAKVPENKPFSYQVGDIVKINAQRNPDLRLTDGFVGVVVETGEGDLGYVETPYGRFAVRNRNVRRLLLNDQERAAGETNIYRMARLMNSAPTSLTVAAVHDISRRSVSCLSGQEEKCLSDAEELANLEKLSTLEELKLDAETISKTVDYYHHNWVLNLVFRNIENFQSGEVGGLANAIAKYKPEEVAKIVLDFASDRKLAEKIIAELMSVYSDLIASFVQKMEVAC